MEKCNESCNQCRNKARPIIMNAAGGGIERVVALGGALAVASIVAAFSMKKGGTKDSNNKDTDNDTTNVAAPAPAPEPATESCAEEDYTSEGMWYIPNKPSSTMHQDSCCTNNGTSNAVVTEIGTSELVSTESSITLEENTIESECMEDSEIIQQETLVHDPEEESNEITGNRGDIQELSAPVSETENNPVKRLASLEMEFIEIMVVDEAPQVDAEQPTPQLSSPSKEEKSSISEGEQQQQYSIMQSSFQPVAAAEEEEEYSSMQLSFPPPPAVEEEEEYSQMRPTFSFGEDRLGEDGKDEDEDEDDLSEESSFSTEEGGAGGEEEEDSTLQSSFSTEVEEDGNGENEAELDEESSEGTRSSSPEPNMEVIWPAEIMTFISSAPKEINLSHLESEMKAIEDVKPNKGEPHHDSARDRFHGRNNNNGRNNDRETGELGVMDVPKQHAANRQTWFWLGLAVLVLALLANCLLHSNYLSNNLSFVFPMK